MGMLVKVFESLSQYSYLRLVYGLFNNAAWTAETILCKCYKIVDLELERMRKEAVLVCLMEVL
jgi:hypothetical protein